MHVSNSPGGWRCGRAFAADDIMSLTERRSERGAPGGQSYDADAAAVIAMTMTLRKRKKRDNE